MTCKKILSLSTNPTLRKELGDNAKKLVIETYSWQRHVERIFKKLSSEDIWDV